MTASLDLRDRDAVFARLARETFDLVVIGAGITGAGIARDAALRGLRVALVDARDFAAGTSSRSTKLVHGGIRYLAHGDVALVREAATERAIVRRIAPHLATKMPFVVCARSRAGVAKLRAGLWTYEKLGSVAAADRHVVWDRVALEAHEPAVRRDAVAGAVVYSEYLTDDARLTIANVRDAMAAGATALNYAAVGSFVVESGRASGVVVTDGLTEGRTARVRSRCIVNAAGPWVDRVLHLEDPSARVHLQLTKGIHVVVARARVPLTRTLMMLAPDRRNVFAIPRGDRIYIGTTDTFCPEPSYWPDIGGDDVRYLLDTANAALDIQRLNAEDVTSAWAGVRPLIAEAGKAPSEISRRDEVRIGPLGVVTIAGGKLTAYRRMAERVVDRCIELLGVPTGGMTTGERPLPGGDFGDMDDLVRELEATTDHETAVRLASLYGSEARYVLQLGGGPAAEAEWAVRHEGAVTLEDWWVRRSARAWFDSDGGERALQSAAERMAMLLGWSPAMQRAQMDKCLAVRRATMNVLDALT